MKIVVKSESRPNWSEIYQLSANISVLPINKMLIGIGYWYRLSVSADKESNIGWVTDIL